MLKTVHGGDIYSREVEYDFSANINPLGMPESVKSAIVNNLNEIERYPDVNCTLLKNAIANFEGICTRNIVCGNGASDLIYRIVNTIMPKKALLVSPTFSEYEKALLSIECEIVYFRLDEKNDFELDDGILNKLSDIDIFFLCNPNNPVGNLVNTALMKRIIQKCADNKIYLIVDECFMDFVSESVKYKVRADIENVIVLKAFTKSFAMPGLRLGYMLCKDADLCERVESCGQCWNVSTVAQISGTAALSEKKYLEKTVRYVKAEREFLAESLERLGVKVYPSKANFIFFKDALPIDELLLKEKIAVRNCSNYVNLGNGYFRIAVRTRKENEILINAIERIFKNG